MRDPSYEARREFESLERDALQRYQLSRLNQLLERIAGRNALYADPLANVELPLKSLTQLSSLPFTLKKDLLPRDSDQEFAANTTLPIDNYVRFHRTSGTHGRPLAVVDTAEDWNWWIETWQYILDAAELTPHDRVAMAFSFGPFIGFWSANDAIVKRGAMAIPLGGLDTVGRLHLILSSRATAICCTPTYALRMAEVAAIEGLDLTKSHVRCIIVAGEPGGSIPTVRDRIESAWSAIVIDHSGATEVGPWGYPDRERRGLHIIESEFIAEFDSVDRNAPANDGELSELIITTLGRPGCPVIRYRTGDLVRPHWDASGDNHFVLLDGGVLGRIDDMMVIRGVNVFPSAVEEILRGFPEIIEYRLTAKRDGEMDSLHIEVEDEQQNPARIAAELKLRLGLNVDVRLAEIHSLPRYDAKGKRFVDQR